MTGLRELGAHRLATVRAEHVRPISVADFRQALRAIRPSSNQEQLRVYEDFTREFGVAA